MNTTTTTTPTPTAHTNSFGVQVTDDRKAAEIGKILLSRSYATQHRLETSDAYFRVRSLRHLILQLANGRWTIVIVDRGWQPALNSGFAILA